MRKKQQMNEYEKGDATPDANPAPLEYQKMVEELNQLQNILGGFMKELNDTSSNFQSNLGNEGDVGIGTAPAIIELQDMLQKYEQMLQVASKNAEEVKDTMKSFMSGGDGGDDGDDGDEKGDATPDAHPVPLEYQKMVEELNQFQNMLGSFMKYLNDASSNFQSNIESAGDELGVVIYMELWLTKVEEALARMMNLRKRLDDMEERINSMIGNGGNGGDDENDGDDGDDGDDGSDTSPIFLPLRVIGAVLLGGLIIWFVLARVDIPAIMTNQSESYTPTPTSTPTPTTHFEDFLSELQTPTPGLEVFGMIDRDTFCYHSPDSNYAAAHFLPAGTQVELVGYSESLAYLAVVSPRNPNLTCYVDKDNMVLPYPLPDLQVLIDPPPPLDPQEVNPPDDPDEPQTCHSGLSPADCIAAGGVWKILVNPPYCACP